MVGRSCAAPPAKLLSREAEGVGLCRRKGGNLPDYSHKKLVERI